jgi:hypothetical protein
MQRIGFIENKVANVCREHGVIFDADLPGYAELVNKYGGVVFKRGRVKIDSARCFLYPILALGKHKFFTHELFPLYWRLISKLRRMQILINRLNSFFGPQAVDTKRYKFTFKMWRELAGHICFKGKP